ncbi:MAG: hypothetical protein ABIA75_04565 [Candidatus Neomarinimicrobiota bacterium]
MSIKIHRLTAQFRCAVILAAAVLLYFLAMNVTANHVIAAYRLNSQTLDRHFNHRQESKHATSDASGLMQLLLLDNYTQFKTSADRTPSCCSSHLPVTTIEKALYERSQSPVRHKSTRTGSGQPVRLERSGS